MRILFWGTPAFAVPSLRALHDEGIEVVGVVTQPDRPAGRGRRLQPSALKQVALELGLRVLTPERPRGEEFLTSIGELAPDMSAVVAYGHILKPEVLDLPPLGFHQRARVFASETARGGTHQLGDRERTHNHRCDDHAHGRRNGCRRHHPSS